MTPIERAARTVAERYGESWDDLPEVNPVANGEWDRGQFLQMGRAALATLKEPSVQMVTAGARMSPLDVPTTIRVFKAMIDAALAEEQRQ